MTINAMLNEPSGAHTHLHSQSITSRKRYSDNRYLTGWLLSNQSVDYYGSTFGLLAIRTTPQVNPFAR